MKQIRFLMIAVLLTFVGRAVADNLVVSGVEINAGETAVVSVELSNPSKTYVAFQFDLALPTGITIAKNSKGKLIGSLNEDRKDDHTLTLSEVEDGKYRFLVYSNTNAEFYETSGEILTFTIAAQDGMTGGQKIATISAQTFTEPSGDQSKWDDFTFPIGVVGAAAPVITAEDKTREYGEDNPEFTYTTSATITGVPSLTTTATKTSPVGNYDIVVEQGTVEGDYTAVNGKLIITKAGLTITGESYTIKQGDPLPTFAATYAGFKNNETEAVLTKKPTLTTTATSASNPGSYDIVVAGAEAQNYDITYVNGKLTIVDADAVIVTAKNYTREYGEANPTFEYTSEGAELTGVPEITCEATATSPAGTYDIVVSTGSITNYNVTYVKGTLTITKAPLTIKAGTYTKKQGEENPEFTLTYEGFKNNETKDVLTKQPTVTCEANDETAPGDYAVTVSGAEAQNYEITYTNGTLTIGEADPVTLTAKSYTRYYGDANPTFEFTSEGATVRGTPEFTCEATATSPVGTYEIVIKKGGVKNFKDTYVNGTLTIVKAPLTIKAGSYKKYLGEENPEFTLTYEGFKNNETKDVLTKQPTVTCEATKDSPVGNYEVVVSGAEAQNYEISYENGTLKITKEEPVTVTAMSYTRIYGNDNPTFEYTSEGAALRGVPEITCEATATSPVGTYPIVVSVGSVTNGEVEFVNGTLTIRKAPLKIIANDCTMKQGDEFPEFTASYEGFKNKETEAVLTKKPAFHPFADNNDEPGEYELKVYGAEAENYEIEFINGILTIVSGDATAIATQSYTSEEPFEVYDIRGRKVRSEATSLNDLPKGVYIINGKKVVK